MAVLLQSEGISADTFEALLSSTSSHAGFSGSRSMLNFEEVCGSTINEPFFRPPREMDEAATDDDLDDCLHQPQKKRRLTANQVQFLEKSFEVENKLEPERKVKLAKDLGMQPRQVAIWFQNRRARWKTKQLEKDYDTLKSSYNALKADYEGLLKEKEKLKAEVVHLTDKLLLKEKHEDITEALELKKPDYNSIIELKKPESQLFGVKQEDHSSSNSEVSHSGSRHCTDGTRTDSSNAFEPDQSGISYVEEDEEVEGYHQFLKLEDNSGSFDFPVEEQALWLWP